VDSSFVQHDAFQVSSGKKRVNQRFVEINHAKNGFSFTFMGILD
jgi:hypothetical protein